MHSMGQMCRDSSLIKSNLLLGPYSRTVSRALWWPQGRGLFLLSEVPLYRWMQLDGRLLINC